MSKIKILWVVYDFVQAGGQRYVYEICKALDKQKYQIDLLQVNAINNDKNWKNEYYYEPTIDLGCRIFSLVDIYDKSIKKLTPFQKNINKILKRVTLKTIFKDHSIQNEQSILKDLFSEYKFINFSGISVYDTVCVNKGLYFTNGIVHILTAKFQGIDIYKGFNKQLHYNFVSGFEPEILKYELNEFKTYKHTYLPLSLECKPFTAGFDPSRTRLVIGVFTRLSFMKPLDPYFYALKLLLEEGVDVELKIYGAGDPVALGFIRQLEYLYIKDRVFFCGHSDSITNTLCDEKFDLIWFQASNTQLAGYAALEIAIGGVPQVLWDFNKLDNKTETDTFFKSFTNLTKFVSYTKDLLSSKDKLKNLGLQQQDYVLEHHSITKNISLLDVIYAD
ncbi:glycosyltransferase involved in cell wall biosynthesis [Flavobacterium sp. 270]|uniref:glycosyltransferase n=1 Tax=Flavobacterium sp. 270 TaxID=2512114 RepID=UPI0010649E27|nr:glycosyltransferase [Flavobacterium sp. 270]TDW47143.1 glycosyltransferase involved in cell wall biosynthesis [Flavobacterium sp. 270]